MDSYFEALSPEMQQTLKRRTPQMVARAVGLSTVCTSESRPEAFRNTAETLNGSSSLSPTFHHTSCVSDRSEKPREAAHIEADAALSLNASELRSLGKALTAKAKGASKQAAIEAAFNCKKGAGRIWARASALFDLALSEG